MAQGNSSEGRRVDHHKHQVGSSIGNSAGPSKLRSKRWNRQRVGTAIPWEQNAWLALRCVQGQPDACVAASAMESKPPNATPAKLALVWLQIFAWVVALEQMMPFSVRWAVWDALGSGLLVGALFQASRSPDQVGGKGARTEPETVPETVPEPGHGDSRGRAQWKRVPETLLSAQFALLHKVSATLGRVWLRRTP